MNYQTIIIIVNVSENFGRPIKIIKIFSKIIRKSLLNFLQTTLCDNNFSIRVHHYTEAAGVQRSLKKEEFLCLHEL